MAERQHSCDECGMLVPSDRIIFHPHVYCMLYKAGVRDPERYMEATFPLLREHFAPLTEKLRHAHAEGESMRSLARRYGITRERVRQIVMATERASARDLTRDSPNSVYFGSSNAGGAD